VSLVGVAELWEEEAPILPILLVLVGTGLLLTLVIAWPRLLGLEHARIIFPHRWICACLIALPALVVALAIGV
jgi:hypothetical protein